MTVTIRPLASNDVARYHALRQRGLAEHPEAFTSSAEEEAAAPAQVAKRLARDPQAPHDVVLGAFDGETLISVVGMSVDPRSRRSDASRARSAWPGARTTKLHDPLARRASDGVVSGFP